MTTRMIPLALSARSRSIALALLAAWLCPDSQLRAGDPGCTECPSCLSGTMLDPRAGCDAACSHAGCDCRSRGTLLQWSYGTSFSGGPDLSEPIVTDRPDFTEASSTVGRRVLQLETGYTYTFDNDGAGQAIGHSYPEMLLRYGVLADWLELRVGQNFATESDGLVDVSGAEDLYLGLKIALTPQECWLPEMAIVPQMTVPTGHDALTDDQVLPGVNWLYGWDINDQWATGGSTQVNRAIDEATGSTHSQWAQSWTVGRSLSDELGSYFEWFAFFPVSADAAKPEHYLNGGFTYLLSDDIQWDIRAGVGLNEAADDYFVGTGLSIRFH